MPMSCIYEKKFGWLTLTVSWLLPFRAPGFLSWLLPFPSQGISGRVVFGERLPAFWFCGASLVVAGVVLLTAGGDSTSSTAGGNKEGADRRQGPEISSPTERARSQAAKDQSKLD